MTFDVLLLAGDGYILEKERPSLAEVPSVLSGRLGEWHVTKHGIFIEHIAEDDAPPEVDPTDGTIWASGRDNLGGVVEEHFGGRVGDGENRVPLRRIQAQLPGGPAARLGVVELEPEQALVVKDDVPEAGDDVAMRVRT